MWRLVLLGLCLSLSGCGFSAWHSLPFVAGHDPHLPAGDSENLRRAEGIPVTTEPLATAPGNIWPGPVTTEPTLETLEKQGPEAPNQVAPPPLPPPVRGSSTPPAKPLPSSPAPIPPPLPPPAGTPVVPLNPPVAGGQVYQTPQGPAPATGGTSAYKTITLPNGTTAIVVPNGNGTSTIINPNGTVETVPTPK